MKLINEELVSSNEQRSKIFRSDQLPRYLQSYLDLFQYYIDNIPQEEHYSFDLTLQFSECWRLLIALILPHNDYLPTLFAFLSHLQEIVIMCCDHNKS